ncbi:unnamed protein product [Fusarium venenatum]|uniref:Uncharacterized protein n=1 Tax=Fusarium venenatum TaxID=56646 RepID=A0A2L2SMN2_9HYPO|nr:uncharacterized protein FVRRES_11185 [Fusarium venenatum]CEI38494.1 unnamed protein product [Fusarium venenatum]
MTHGALSAPGKGASTVWIGADEQQGSCWRLHSPQKWKCRMYLVPEEGLYNGLSQQPTNFTSRRTGGFEPCMTHGVEV